MPKLELKEPNVKVLHAKKLSVTKPNHKKTTLIVLPSTLPGNFFAEEALVTLCKLRNNSKIKTTALLNTEATEYSFVDPLIACHVCNNLVIEPIKLSKSKAIQSFDKKLVLNITHVIYSTMTIQDRTKTTTSMVITKLGQH